MDLTKLIGRKFEIINGADVEGMATVKKIIIDYPTVVSRSGDVMTYRAYCAVRFDGDNRQYPRWVSFKYDLINNEIIAQ